jgi:ABC-type nitrate/sulfonate/bicarbonate transport system substrate-binding protein
MTLRIGTHPNNPSLTVFSRRAGVRESLARSGVDVDFFAYNSGNQTIPLFTAGALDIGGTGSTPPLHALAAGLDVVLLAVTPPRPDRGGLVVTADSPVRELAELAGRSIAIMPTSWHPQLLVESLGSAGLAWRDVTVVELNDATARAALLRGSIDAWVVTDPALAELEREAPMRILAPVGQHHSNRSVIWGMGPAVDGNLERIAILLGVIDASDQEIAARPDEAARLLVGDGTDPSGWARVLAERSWGLHRPDDDFVAEHQRHADLLVEAGVLAQPIDVAKAVRGPAF